METLKLLFSLPEAGRVLCLSRSKLYLEMEAGRISSVKNGSRRFIHRDELERYAAGLSSAP